MANVQVTELSVSVLPGIVHIFLPKTPAEIFLVMKLAFAGKRADVDFTAKKAETGFTAKKPSITFEKLDC